ncbi:hypothetical protein AOR11_24550 [Vibrio alginolyticus]|nr:hypothetical protein AOR11_24550 [Vibrio alginolyticus]
MARFLMQQDRAKAGSGLAGLFGVVLVLLDAEQDQHASGRGERAHLQLGDVLERGALGFGDLGHHRAVAAARGASGNGRVHGLGGVHGLGFLKVV